MVTIINNLLGKRNKSLFTDFNLKYLVLKINFFYIKSTNFIRMTFIVCYAKKYSLRITYFLCKFWTNLKTSNFVSVKFNYQFNNNLSYFLI